MVQVLEQQGPLFGRIGKGIAQGLSEQVPKEIERYRLSKGLENLGKSKEKLTPFEQASQLVNIPGMNPQNLATFLPLLQQQLANREAADLANKGRGAPQAAGSSTRTSGKGQQGAPGGAVPSSTPRKSLIQPEGEQAQLNRIAPLTVEERRARGAELHQLYPNQYPTVAAGEAAAEDERNSDIAQQEAVIKQGESQKSLRTELETSVKGRLERDIQKSGQNIFQMVPGEYFSKILDKADQEVASGEKSTKQAGDDAAAHLREYGLARLANEREGAKSWLGKSPAGVRSQLKSLRNKYNELGEDKTFVNDLIANHNMSRAGASWLAYPIQENKDLNNYLSKEKAINPLSTLFTSKTGLAETKARKVADDLPKYIGDKDSLAAIAAELQGKNYDGEAFLDQVRTLWSEGKIRLNQRQQDELQNTGSLDPSLGDWFLFSMGELGSLPEVK